MSSRARTVASLLALVALSLSFVEGVWASTCSPEMADMAVHSSAEAPLRAADCMDGMVTPAENAESERPDAPPSCPIVPLATAGSCAVAASLPASSSVGLAAISDAAFLIRSASQSYDLLFVTAPFHPPRP